MFAAAKRLASISGSSSKNVPLVLASLLLLLAVSPLAVAELRVEDTAVVPRSVKERCKATGRFINTWCFDYWLAALRNLTERVM